MAATVMAMLSDSYMEVYGPMRHRVAWYHFGGGKGVPRRRVLLKNGRKP